MVINSITVGARGSALSIAQVNLFKQALLYKYPNLKINYLEIKTSGDNKQGTAAARTGDKKDWILEIEHAILEEKIDLAIHCGKDVPSDYEVGTEIFSVLPREDARDIFIGQKDLDGQHLAWSKIPKDALIGTASLRRQASLLAALPNIKVCEHRGNVNTRIQKLYDSKQLTGIILAKAGVQRLGLWNNEFETIAPTIMMPAVNQGILCAQIKSRRSDLKELLSPIIDRNTQVCFEAERACILVLGADCKSSVSAYAEIKNGEVSLSARVLSRDGQKKVELLHQQASFDQAGNLGKIVGEKLLELGAGQIIKECRDIL